MPGSAKRVRVGLFASERTSASGLFGLYDVLSSVGVGWESFVTGEPEIPRFEVQIIAARGEPFRCASGNLVTPDAALHQVAQTDIVVFPGVFASASQPLGKSDAETFAWIHDIHGRGVRLVGACTGALYLAEAGLLDGVEATTHWAYEGLFRAHYPKVRLRLEKNLCFADANDGVVTSGGTTAWQELALFLITNYLGVEQAVRAAKLWLLPDQGELQAPFRAMPLGIPHSDADVRRCQVWIADNYTMENPVTSMIEYSGLAPTTFARRFRRATGYSPMGYIQAVRVEESKQMLETSNESVESVGFAVGYEDTASFRRLFKRKTGLNPGDYRRMFGRDRFRRYARFKRRSLDAG